MSIVKEVVGHSSWPAEANVQSLYDSDLGMKVKLAEGRKPGVCTREKILGMILSQPTCR